MKRTILIAALFAVGAALAGCKQGATAAKPAAAPASPAVATIDGTPISSDLFDFYLKNRSNKAPADLTLEEKKSYLDELIKVELTAQAAVKQGLDQESDTAKRLELNRANLLAEAAFQKHLDGKQPTEQELRTEYETQVAAMPKLEYHARHILVATEGYADSLIAKLQKGADFADLARKESMDSSKSNGGDLGWFTPTRMVPEFANAVVGLKKGEITPKPVQTKFGWHIIKLDDTRDVAPPDFDQVKDRLGQIVQQKKLQAYVDELKKQAKIEIKI